jgi:hypothetical protein
VITRPGGPKNPVTSPYDIAAVKAAKFIQASTALVTCFFVDVSITSTQPLIYHSLCAGTTLTPGQIIFRCCQGCQVDSYKVKSRVHNSDHLNITVAS